jgi:regulator of nucleoside diphosphate kinase
MMEVSTYCERTLTNLDHARLVKLTSQHRVGPPLGGAGHIEDALDIAHLVSSRDVSPDIVTMYSQVLLKDCASARRYRLTLCYPSDAEPSAGFISVLSPVGASLLGLKVGATARWVTPNGDQGAAQVAALLFQPEASGDFTL